MSDSETESVQTEIEAETDVPETTEEIIIPETPVKKPGSRKISKKQQRLNAIDDYKNGRENNDFKVYPLKNGSYRVIKRENTTVKNNNDIETKPEITPVINQTYTDNQFLINHLLELEKKFEKLRLKTKKLKKSHKKLKNDIYDDDSEMPVDLNTVSEKLDGFSHEINNNNSSVVSNEVHEKNTVELTPVRYNKGKKLSWRQMLNN